MKSKIKNLFAIIAILLSLSELATVANAQYVQRSLPITGGALTGNLIINSDYLEIITANATANLYMQSSYAGDPQIWDVRANGYDRRFDIEHWTGSAFTHPLIIDISDNFTISGNQTVQGSNNTMPNQTLTGATSVMTEGLADTRYIKPSMIVYTGSTQTFPVATTSKATFSVVERDAGSWWSTSTNRCTPPAGYYTVRLNIIGDPFEGVITLRKNGGDYRYFVFNLEAITWRDMNLTVDAYANGTDYFEVYVYPANGNVTWTAGGNFQAANPTYLTFIPTN